MGVITEAAATDKTLAEGLMSIVTAINNKSEGGGGDSIIADESETWSSNKSYTVGQTVIDDNRVWECTVNNSNKKPKDNATYWTQITLSALNAKKIINRFDARDSNFGISLWQALNYFKSNEQKAINVVSVRPNGSSTWICGAYGADNSFRGMCASPTQIFTLSWDGSSSSVSTKEAFNF